MWRVVDASLERPYLAVALVLDPAAIASVLIESGSQRTTIGQVLRQLQSVALTRNLIDVVERLLRLLDRPR